MWDDSEFLFAKTDNTGDGEYKDIFHRKDTEWLNEPSKNAKASIKKSEKNQCLDKDENIAQTARMSGNKFFEAKKFHNALEEYNRSLCYSKIGSENIGLAYSNRSGCYFYVQCIYRYIMY